MRNLIIAIVLTASAVAVRAQGVPPAGAHDQTLTGNNSLASPLGVRVATGGGLDTGGGVGGLKLGSCTVAGQAWQWTGSAWACADMGDITAVTAGSGLTGGGTSGAVTLTLAITPTTCTGQFVTAISALGVATCTTVSGTISGLTTGTLPKAGSATTLVDSIISEATGTATVAGALHTTGNFDVASTKLTVNATTGNTVVLGSLTADAGNRVIDAVGSAAITQTANSIDLPTLLTAGSCTSCNLTYDKYGRLTVAANGSGGSITGSGTANTTTKWTGTSAIGNAWALDDGTTWGVSGKFTITESTGDTSVQGALLADGGHRVMDSAGTGLTQALSTVSLNMAGASCSAGSFMSALSATGTGSCTAGGSGTVTGTGTANTTTKWTGTSAIGNAWALDDGTTWGVSSKFTITEASGNTAVNGTLTADAGHRVFDIAGTGLTSSTNTITLNMAGASCSAGSFVSAITATGGTTCTAAGGVISGLTTNAIVKASSSTTIANSSMSDDGTNVTLTENVNGTTANFTNGTQPATFTAYANGSGRTTNVNALDNETFATYDTTAAARTGYGLQAWSYGTRSAGANNLTNIAILANAFNGQLNYSFYGQTGQFYQAATGEFAGALVADTTLHVGAGTDAATIANNAAIFENAGTTSIAVRDSTNHHEFYARALTTGGVEVGSSTNDVFAIRTNNTIGFGMDTAQNVTLYEQVIAPSTGPSPTINSCGTGGSVSGTDFSFIINVGTSTTTCSITFAHTMAQIPSCWASANVTAAGAIAVTAAATTGITFSPSATALSGDKLYGGCIGH